MKNRLSPTRFAKISNSIPNHIKSLFLGKSNLSKSRLFQGRDRLIMKDRELLGKVTYFTIVKVEVLTGYKESKITGETMLNSPIWEMLNPDDLLDMQGDHFCRMVYHKDKDFGIGIDERTLLPFTNKHFFISGRNLYENNPSPNMDADIDESVAINNYLNTSDLDMKYATTNIMVQVNNYFTDSDFSSPAQEVNRPVRFGSATPSATGAGQGAGPGIGSGGGSGGGYSSGGGY